jgi:rRNA processing protein Gar1
VIVKIERKSKSRRLKLNIPVYTRDAKRVGMLIDVIGPVQEPFGVVKPDVVKELEPGLRIYYRLPLSRRRIRHGRKRRDNYERRGGALKQGMRRKRKGSSGGGGRGGRKHV